MTNATAMVSEVHGHVVYTSYKWNIGPHPGAIRANGCENVLLRT